MTELAMIAADTGGADPNKADAQGANVALLREAYEHWNATKGISIDGWLALIADDLKLGSLAGGAALVANMNGSGKDAFLFFFENISKHWSLLNFAADEFIAEGNSVVMRGRIAWQNKRTGKVFSSPKIDYWRFRDGKAIEFFECCDTAGIQAAASG